MSDTGSTQERSHTPFDEELFSLQRLAYGASAPNRQQWLRKLLQHVHTAPSARHQALGSAFSEDLGKVAVARHGGADPDRADYKDTLGEQNEAYQGCTGQARTFTEWVPCVLHAGILPAAKGVGTFLAHPDTPALAMAVYGPWGHGKVSVMDKQATLKRFCRVNDRLLHNAHRTKQIWCCVCSVQSTFMKLVEEQMLLQAALNQLDVMELTDDGLLHAEYVKIRERIEKHKATQDDRRALQALASPQLMTVWFNAW